MKNLQITPAMQSKINASAGADVDPSAIQAFECLALSNLPVSKPGSIFNGATYTPGFQAAMASYIAQKGGVPLQVMHDSAPLPTGRVYDAGVQPDGLHAQFYLPTNDPQSGQINLGIVPEVSVGALATHLFCSVCNWDYRGPDATFMNLMDQTCGNGHVIGGPEGAHLNLDGLDAWFELSLVGAGASPGAKILSRAKAALMNSSTLDRLAASGTPAEAIILISPPTKEITMDLASLSARLETQSGEIAVLKASAVIAATKQAEDTAKIAELTAALATKDQTHATALATATTELGTVKTELAAAKLDADTQRAAFTTANAELTSLKATNTAVTTELTASKTFLKDMAGKALIAMGKNADAVPEDLAGMEATIKEAGVHLANLAALSERKVEKTTELGASHASSAFKTRA